MRSRLGFGWEIVRGGINSHDGDVFIIPIEQHNVQEPLLAGVLHCGLYHRSFREVDEAVLDAVTIARKTYRVYGDQEIVTKTVQIRRITEGS